MDFFGILFDVKNGSKVPYSKSYFDTLFAAKLAEMQIKTITGTLPITFRSNGTALINYRIFGTADGAGDNSYNLCNVTPLEATWATPVPSLKDAFNALSLGTYTFSCKLRLLTRPNPTHTEVCGLIITSNSTVPGQTFSIRPTLLDAKVGDVIVVEKAFSITSSNIGMYTNAYAYGCGIEGVGATGSAYLYDIVINEGSETLPYVPYGYKLPLTTSGTESKDTDIYIGDSKLLSGDYVDYESGKIVRNGTPQDPPLPLPAIETFNGKNTLDSTETLGEVTIKGRIKPQS